MKIEEFTKYLEAIAKVTGRSNIDDFIVGLYWESLEHSKDEALRSAMKTFFTTNRWPSIDDIKSQMGEKTESLEDRARAVALEITDQITKRGYMAEKEVMQVLSPVAKAVVICNGGWVRICDIDDSNKLPWKQKDWMREALDIISTGRLGDLIGPTPVASLIGSLAGSVKDPANWAGSADDPRSVKSPRYGSVAQEWPDFPGVAPTGRGETLPLKMGGKYRGGIPLPERLRMMIREVDARKAREKEEKEAAMAAKKADDEKAFITMKGQLS
jgi:hypothetical protein